MLVGHHAVGFAAKRVAPRVSLGTLQIACVLPDLLTFALQLVGIEHARVTPGITAFSPLQGCNISISHSLATDVIWSALFAGAYVGRRRDKQGAWVLFWVVLSHWVLDMVSHRSQIPLLPGVHLYVGLGLWYSIPATFIVEGALWMFGIAVYVRATQSTTRLSAVALTVFVGILTVAWIRTPFGSLPAGDFSHATLLTLLVIHAGLFALAYWIDRHRPPTTDVLGDPRPVAPV